MRRRYDLGLLTITASLVRPFALKRARDWGSGSQTDEAPRPTVLALDLEIDRSKIAEQGRAAFIISFFISSGDFVSCHPVHSVHIHPDTATPRNTAGTDVVLTVRPHPGMSTPQEQRAGGTRQGGLGEGKRAYIDSLSAKDDETVIALDAFVVGNRLLLDPVDAHRPAVAPLERDTDASFPKSHTPQAIYLCRRGGPSYREGSCDGWVRWMGPKQ